MEKNILGNNLKLIIFDMDGVLLDSEPLHENARQMMYKELKISPDKNLPDPVGKSSSGFWRTVIRECGIEGDPYELENRQYAYVARQIEENHVPPSEGLVDVIKMAKEKGLKIGLASSSTRPLVDDTLRLLGIKEYFDYTVSGDEVSKKKPSPEVYLKVLGMAGVKPENAVAVEDSSTGIDAAKSAGIFCYGYKNETSGSQDIGHARQVIEKLNEIIL